ncbi:MAG: redoxin domain-containing protein [Tepidisphaeraceae bacterium]
MSMRSAFIFCLLFCGSVGAQTTQPAITPEAQALLDRVARAYAQLDSLSLCGTLSLEFDAAGQTASRRAQLVSSFRAGGRYRHDLSDDVLIVSDGTRTDLLRRERNQVCTSKDGGGFDSILHEQNPALLLAASGGACAALTDGARAVSREPDVRVAPLAGPAPKNALDDRPVVVVIDPRTDMVRQVRTDLRRLLEKRGVPRVREAVVTIDYSTIAPHAKLDESEFRFVAPHDATLVAFRQGPDDPSDVQPSDEPAMSLVGNPAPDFALADLDGKQVSLSDLKGNVVVSDFFATWCPPCRASLPHLDKLAAAHRGKGVVVYAIDLSEDREKVLQFITDQKLSLPVLLDSEGKTARSYLVQPIPQTVVIGRDGVVRRVFIGFDPDRTPQDLATSIERALAPR